MMKNIKNESGIASIVLIVGVALIFIYLVSFSFAYRGWGYYGYYGYHRGPSFLYWHGGSVYPNSPNMKTGGVKSPRHSSKGMRGGK